MRRLLLILVLLLGAGCRPPVDPIIGKWEMASAEVKVAWVFLPDGRGETDISHMEALIRQRLGTRPMSERVRRKLDEEREKTFTWKRESGVYRLEAPWLEATPLGRAIYLRIRGNRLSPCKPDGSGVDEGGPSLTRVRRSRISGPLLRRGDVRNLYA